MNKVLIVDASESDRRLMSGLLTRAGYEPIARREYGGGKRRGGETATRRGRGNGDEIRPRKRVNFSQITIIND